MILVHAYFKNSEFGIKAASVVLKCEAIDYNTLVSQMVQSCQIKHWIVQTCYDIHTMQTYIEKKA